jgi:hypothetical protein
MVIHNNVNSPRWGLLITGTANQVSAISIPSVFVSEPSGILLRSIVKSQQAMNEVDH